MQQSMYIVYDQYIAHDQSLVGIEVYKEYVSLYYFKLININKYNL